MKKISNIFWILAALLTNVMCAVVGYNFCNMRIGVMNGGYSAPVSVAFLYAIPFVVGISVCVALALVFKARNGNHS